MFAQIHYLADCASTFYRGAYPSADAVLGLRNLSFLCVIENKVPCSPYQYGLSTAELNALIRNAMYVYGAKTDALRAEFCASGCRILLARILTRMHYQLHTLLAERDFAAAARAGINYEAILFFAGRHVRDVHLVAKDTDAYIAKCAPDVQSSLRSASLANRRACWAMACGWCGRYQPQLLAFCDADCIAKYAACCAQDDEDDLD
jgi:hypothetical protein